MKTSRYERWLRRAERVRVMRSAEEIDLDALADACALAASCGAYLIEEQPELAAELRAAAAGLEIDLADGARRNAAQREHDRMVNS